MGEQTGHAEPPREDGLSDADISFLCDIGDFFPDDADNEKSRRVERLLEDGWLAPAVDDRTYALTRKAQEWLAERGVGLNEA